MSRRPTEKPIHYVRAIYNQNTAPKYTLEQLIRAAMRKLGSMGQTEVAMGNLGTAVIRHRRDAADEPLLLDIGAGIPGEQMTTVGLKVKAAEDVDQSTQPPTSRAFKLSEAFVLIDKNDLLIMTEGSFRTAGVAVYLRLLISKANLKAGDSAFELRKVTNQETAAVLEAEGIKELRLNTNMYRATRELSGADEADSKVTSTLKSFVGTLKDMFAEDMSEAKRALLAKHWDEMQVNTVIRADGGSRAEEIVLDVMNIVGQGVIEEEDDSVEVTVITKKNTEIHLGQVTPIKKVRLFRRSNANDLVNTDVYTVLKNYRTELITQRHWQK